MYRVTVKGHSVGNIMPENLGNAKSLIDSLRQKGWRKPYEYTIEQAVVAYDFLGRAYVACWATIY